MDVGNMNGTTLLLWINILIIAIIAIVGVKLYYRRDKLAKEEGSILPNAESLTNLFKSGKDNASKNTNKSKSKVPGRLNKVSSDKSSSSPISFEEPVIEIENESANNASSNSVSFEEPAIEIENEDFAKYEYQSPNQVLVNYDNTVQKFQEPINQNQMDIMTQNNDPKNEKHELKDLFTIDELIKESKRKDSQREKESQSIKKDEDDGSLDEIKESIKQRQENKQEEPLIEEVIQESEKEETINDIISSTTEEEIKPKTEMEIESPLIASQKDIEQAIETAGQESEEEIESISKTDDITDALLDADKQEPSEEEIKEPVLKTPAKVDETKKDYPFGADLNEGNVFDDDNDLDYRKDLAKITNTIKGSKIFQDVKERLTQDDEYQPVDEQIEESFIRNVNEYEDEFAPIINETHADFDATYEEYHDPFFDEQLREENTRKVFSQPKSTPEPQSSGIGSIKEKPERDNIKIKLGNNDVVLKKGDEIIFNHLGETYSSQVYAINGDDISVKYRRQNITIKPSDVKKVY